MRQGLKANVVQVIWTERWYLADYLRRTVAAEASMRLVLCDFVAAVLSYSVDSMTVLRSWLIDHLPARVAIPVRAGFGHKDPEIAYLHRFVKPGATVLDVGANKGAYAWHLSRLVGAGGHLHAFEPQPELAARLRVGLGSRVKVHPCGLSDRQATLTLNIPIWKVPILGNVVEHGHASLEPGTAADVQIDVEVRTLDSFELAPSFIKVDIEGHEVAMLRGAQETIGRSRPALLLEIDYRHKNEISQRRELLEWLKANDYELFYVRGDALVAAPALVAETDPNPAMASAPYVFNWFAVPAPSA